MARIKGSFITSNNYEVKKTAPFDARMLVKKKSDLTESLSWSITGVYNGMIVAVGDDPEKSNNGLYILTDVNNITSLSSWSKFAEWGDVQEKIDLKQDELIAGDNIVIKDNVISAVSSGGGFDSITVIDGGNAEE